MTRSERSEVPQVPGPPREPPRPPSPGLTGPLGSPTELPGTAPFRPRVPQDRRQDSAGGENDPEGNGEKTKAKNDIRQEAAATAYERVVAGLRDIVVSLEDLSQAWEGIADAANLPSDRLDELQGQVGLLEDITNEMVTAGPGQPPALGLETVATASVIEDDLAEMQDTAASVAIDSGSTISKTLARIMKIWNQTVKWLWNLISHLLMPKEWSLSGGIKLPGLAHAGISVTFG